MKKIAALLVTACLSTPSLFAQAAADLPSVRVQGGSASLRVQGEPFLLLGGELGNSSAGTAAQADTILPNLQRMHVNTELMPAAWEQIEPTEGHYDFSILDHWIDTARTQHMHLVLLWFGSWKNAFSNYTPLWVKSDTKRFPRAIAANGQPTEILSTFAPETLRCDSRAFAALLHHVREKDAAEQTVLMVQVENEVGFLGVGGRDRSTTANAQFGEAVPQALKQWLASHPEGVSRELARVLRPTGSTWQAMFGDAADEMFMAWHYATFIDAVAAAGKSEYPLPMYTNTQLPSPFERAGEYPSGGPHPLYLSAYRAATTHIDFFSPDIYWPNFSYWIDRYRFPGNAVFIPEARLESAPYNALYAYGEAGAFGFSPFGIDSLQAAPQGSAANAPAMQQVYAMLSGMGERLLKAQQQGLTRGLVLHKDSPRPTQTVALGGYLFTGTLDRSWPEKKLLTDDGAMLVMQTAPDEFLIGGSGLTVSLARDPDTDTRNAGIGSIESVLPSAQGLEVVQRLTGDQSNQGRELQMDAKQFALYRVRLYSYAR